MASCVRVPEDEARRMGWLRKGAAAAGKAYRTVAQPLRAAKDALLSTSKLGTSLNKQEITQNSADVKDLMDYQTENWGINNKADTFVALQKMTARKAARVSPDRGAAKLEEWFTKERDDAVKNGTPKAPEPQDVMQKISQAKHYAQANAMRRFRENSLAHGTIASLLDPLNRADFKKLKTTYPELEDPVTKQDYGVYSGSKAVKEAHHDVFSALEKGRQNIRGGEPRREGEGGAAFAGRRAKHLVANLPGMSTAAIMWTPFFHIYNIMGRWIVPMIARGPTSWARTGEAYRAAMRDMYDPDRSEVLGHTNFVRVAQHAWMRDGAPQFRNLILKFPVVGKALGPALRPFFDMMDKMMPDALNFAGHIYYHVIREQAMRDGYSPLEASTMAGLRATTLMGTIPKDMMGRYWREFGDKVLFSNRYTTTTIQLGVRALEKDEYLRTRLKQQGVDADRLAKVVRYHQAQFAALLLKDYLAMQIISNSINYAMTSAYNMEDKHGKKGGHFVWDNPGSTWYSDIANVKYVVGRDSKTGRPIMAGSPIRSTRDLLEMATGWYAVASGADPEPSVFTPYLNKVNQFWSFALDALKGTDWTGKTLNMPTGKETAASYVGDAIEKATPLQIRDAFVAATVRMEGGDPAMWKDFWGAVDDQNIKQMAALGVARVFGGQTSMGTKYGENKRAYYDMKDRVLSLLSDQAIRRELAKGGDSAISKQVRGYLDDLGIHGRAQEVIIQRAIRSQEGMAPVSRAIEQFSQEHL